MSEVMIDKQGLHLLCSTQFDQDVVTQCFSTRKHGLSLFPSDDLNLAYHVKDSPANVDENRRRLSNALSISSAHLICAEQVHGNHVHSVTQEDLEDEDGGALTIESTDGLITAERNVALMLVYADCVPVFLYDPQTPAIGIVHAGWKGIVGQISTAAIEKMTSRFNTKPNMLHAYIGPSIGKKAFEVKDDVAKAFKNVGHSSHIHRHNETFNIDLKSCVYDELIHAGLDQRKIDTSDYCTFDHPEWFFSHRREQGQTGRMAGVIILRQE